MRTIRRLVDAAVLVNQRAKRSAPERKSPDLPRPSHLNIPPVSSILGGDHAMRLGLDPISARCVEHLANRTAYVSGARERPDRGWSPCLAAISRGHEGLV